MQENVNMVISYRGGIWGDLTFFSSSLFVFVNFGQRTWKEHVFNLLKGEVNIRRAYTPALPSQIDNLVSTG